MSISPEVYVIVLILAFLLSIPVTLVLSRFIKKKKFLFPIAGVTTLASAIVVYVCLILLWIHSSTYYSTRPFDSNQWQVNAEERFKMSEDLIDSGILIGKTKDEVLDLLGPLQDDKNLDIWYYNLGFVPGHGIDPDVLSIYFVDGKVVRVEQRRT